MAAPHAGTVTAEEYLREERAASARHELVNGSVYAMSGASRSHNRIVGNFYLALRRLLGDRCETFMTDMRVSVASSGMYTYPDLAIVCGEASFEDESVDTLTNPLALVEVLSPSTEAYDRGAKFLHYKTIPSLRAYLLVAQDYALVEIFIRDAGGDWVHRQSVGREAQVAIPPLDLVIPLRDLYDGVNVEDSLPGRSDPTASDVK